MQRRSRVEPCEILRAAQQPADSSPPSLTVERVPRQAQWRLSFALTPLDAFAAGALVVSALALAWSLGASGVHEPFVRTKSSGARSLEEVRRQMPVRYEDLAVDRGVAD